MGITVYSLLWVMQDFDHQPYDVYWSYEASFKALQGFASALDLGLVLGSWFWMFAVLERSIATTRMDDAPLAP